MGLLNGYNRPIRTIGTIRIGGIEMILTIPHLKRGEIMSPRSKETVRIIKGELLSIEVVVEDMYEDKLFFVGVREPGKWYVKVKMVLSYSKEYRESIETACVYSSKHYENATYVGKRLLEKFHRAMDEETKIDIAGMVKGILIENNIAEPEPESTGDGEDEGSGDEEESEDTIDTIEKWARDDLPTGDNGKGNGGYSIKRYGDIFQEGQFTRCGLVGKWGKRND